MAFFLGCAFELDLCPLDIPARFAHGDSTWATDMVTKGL